MRLPTNSDPEERSARKQALGQALRRLRGDVSQGDFGKRLPNPIPQTTLSRWELGEADLTLEAVRDLEITLDVRPGTLAAEAGYIEMDPTLIDTATVIMADPTIHPEFRESLLTAYRSFQKHSDALREKPRTAAKKTARRRTG